MDYAHRMSGAEVMSQDWLEKEGRTGQIDSKYVERADKAIDKTIEKQWTKNSAESGKKKRGKRGKNYSVSDEDIRFSVDENEGEEPVFDPANETASQYLAHRREWERAKRADEARARGEERVQALMNRGLTRTQAEVVDGLRERVGVR